MKKTTLKINDIRHIKPGVPVLALTATATPRVVNDIQDKLGFARENVFRMSFERKNLAYIVTKTSDKCGEMLRLLGEDDGSTIIYVRSRKRTKEISDLLNDNGIKATFYNAGLETAVRDARQKDWQDGRTRVMVATNAFGMGIDKADVRLVLHIDCPDSIEAYFQEAGRAGRDGKPSKAVMLYDGNDRAKLLRRIDETFPDKDNIMFKRLGSSGMKTRLELPDGSILNDNMVSYFVNNEVNKNTATIPIYLEYANQERILVAGNYVNVILSSAEETPAIICGGSLGFVFLGIVEVFDGMSSGWGFSWGDMAANTFGTALFMSQQLLWHEQKITMKYSFHQTKYSQYRPDLLGSNIIENSIKDYNGMTIWLSFNIKSLILKKDSKFPSWINVAIGLGADGMTGAFENVSSHNGIPVPEYQRCRQFYISPDIDLTRIPTNNKFLKTTLKILNFIKIPLPALEYNSNGNFVWHWIYF